MRAPKTEATATAGASDVIANFERIGWAPVPNAYHDLGTDLLVGVRDQRRFDRGLVIGVQVKAGPSYFEDPSGEGERSGWWYYENSAAHFDDWVCHGLPHILVLHDLESRISYWAHVTAQSCESTSKGCKLFVPKDQVVSKDCFDDLLSVASAQKAASALEGTAYDASALGLPPARRLRYALLAPRLVAPHPNAGVSRTLEPEEAIALLATFRFDDAKNYLRKYPVRPDPLSNEDIADWRWEMVRAFNDLMDGHATRMRQLAGTHLPAHGHVAASILLANLLAKDEEFEEADALLTKLLVPDTCSPVDTAWALVQRARLRAECGSVVEARADALSAQRALVGDGDDATASVLAGSAAWILFSTSAFGVAELKSVIKASDTTIGWWRKQAAVSGLDQYSADAFRTWGEDTATRFARDSVDSYFCAAILNAELSGDSSSIRNLTSSHARITLMSAHAKADAPGIVRALNDLRRIGDQSALKLAASKLWRTGPIESLSAACRLAEPRKLGRTSVRGFLELIASAGDVVSADQAEFLATWALDILTDADKLSEFTNRFEFGWSGEADLLRVVDSLLPVVGRENHSRAIQHLLSIRRTDGPLATDYVRLCHSLSIEIARQFQVELRAFAGQEHPAVVSAALLGLLSRSGDSVAADQLIERCARADIYALSEIGNVTQIGLHASQRLVEHMASHIETIISDAKRGRVSFGEFNAGQILSLLNLNFPEAAKWEPIRALLSEPLVSGEDKGPACRLVCAFVDELGIEVREALRSAVAPLRSTRTHVFTVADEIQGLADSLEIALGATDAESSISRLLSGGAPQRRDATVLIGQGRATKLEPALAGLVGDASQSVRTAAAGAIGSLIARGRQDPYLEAALKRVATDSGAQMPLACLSGLRNLQNAPTWVWNVIEPLRNHPSARVRDAARKLPSPEFTSAGDR